MSKKILIAEDDPEYQDLQQTIFSTLYEVTVVDSAEAAFGKLDKEHFDLIVSDINLFGMSGLEILKKIKGAGLTQEIPVILCSGQANPFVKEQAMELGAAGFVTKPFDIDALLGLVHSLLK